MHFTTLPMDQMAERKQKAEAGYAYRWKNFGVWIREPPDEAPLSIGFQFNKPFKGKG